MPRRHADSRLRSHSPTRRTFLTASMVGGAGLLFQQQLLAAPSAAKTAEENDNPTMIGTRRELFIDRALVDKLTDGANQRLHHPVPQEISLQHDEPWEGTGCGYHSVFQDGDLYRMYYKAWHLGVKDGTLNTGRHPLYCCYAESNDGIQWRKPELGIHEFQGSKKNNIVMVSGVQGPLNVDAGHPAVFKDDNPNVANDARYKAILRSSKPNGLLPFKSPDGIHWSPLTDKPILHGLGAFDSQNLAFWDPNISKYRAYWRIFTEGVTNDAEWKPGGYRAIRTATSDDLVHWEPHTDITYEDSPNEHLYTNQIKPYARAPHLLIGFPARYIDRGWSPSMKDLPSLEDRESRSAVAPRYGTALTDSLLMASRDGLHFTRWNEAFLRPGSERPETWHYGQQYLAWHLVETASTIKGADNQLSLYSVEGYWHGEGSVLRRYTMRLDGFVSVNAPISGGELITTPVLFSGKSLHLNFASSVAGTVRVELQNPDGSAIEGFSLDLCDELFGDTVDRQVTWKNNSDVSRLAGQPIRLRFVLKDADLYSYCFQGKTAQAPSAAK